MFAVCVWFNTRCTFDVILIVNVIWFSRISEWWTTVIIYANFGLCIVIKWANWPRSHERGGGANANWLSILYFSCLSDERHREILFTYTISFGFVNVKPRRILSPLPMLMVYARPNARPELIKWHFLQCELNGEIKKKKKIVCYDHCSGFFFVSFDVIHFNAGFVALQLAKNSLFAALMERIEINVMVSKTISTWSHVQFTAQSANEPSLTKWHIQLNSHSKESNNNEKNKINMQACRFQTGNFTEEKKNDFFLFLLWSRIISAIDCFLSKTGRIYIHFDLTFQFIKRMSCIIALVFPPSVSSAANSVDFNWFFKEFGHRKKNRWLCRLKSINFVKSALLLSQKLSLNNDSNSHFNWHECYDVFH